MEGKDEVKNYIVRLIYFESNINKIYVLVWTNCAKGLQVLIRLEGNYKTKLQEFDGVWLLEQVEARLAGIKDVKKSLLLVQDKMIQLILTRKHDNNILYQ